MIVSPPLTALLVGLVAWLGGASGAALDRHPARRIVVERETLIIRVPIAQRREPLLEWAEHDGPKCVPAVMIVGAAMATPSTIDFVLRDRRRVRARLDSDCAGLDFYGGFYVEPRQGGVCAKRDEIRSRSGSTCRIERFKSLKPKFKH
jgi:hypothetical protein